MVSQMFRPKLKTAKKAITQGQQPTGVVGGGPVAAPQPQAQAPQQPQNMQMNAATKPPSQLPGMQTPAIAPKVSTLPRLNTAQLPGSAPAPKVPRIGSNSGVLDWRSKIGAEPAEPKGDPIAPPPDNRSNEEMISDLVREYLAGGPADTAEQEDLVEKQIRQQLERDLMDQRARAGASGFEASGSLMGMDADARLMANQAATEQILGIRSDADQEAFDRAMSAAGLDLKQREQAGDEMLRQAQLEFMNNWLESQGAEPIDEGGSAIGDIAGGGAGGVADAALDVMDPQGDSQLATSDLGTVSDSVGNAATERSSKPGNYNEAAEWTDGDGTVWMMYKTPNGWVKVRKGGSSIDQSAADDIQQSINEGG